MTAALEQEIQEYEAYVAEDGKRRQERIWEPRSAEQIQRLEELDRARRGGSGKLKSGKGMTMKTETASRLRESLEAGTNRSGKHSDPAAVLCARNSG